MDGGKVIERGTHEQLMAVGGVYAEMLSDYVRGSEWRIGDEA